MTGKNDWMPDFESRIDEGDVVVAGIGIFQAITPDGRPSYYIKYTPHLDDMMALGMLDSAAMSLREHIQSKWRSDE